MSHNLRDFRMGLLSNVCGDLFREIPSDEAMSDKVLLALHSVYGTVLEKALELLEKNCVTFLHDPESTRYIVQVSSSSGTLYTLLPDVNYCACPAYRYHVVGARTELTCKHILAAQLAATMGKVSNRQLSGQEMAEVLLRNSEDIC